ncbi:MAG: SH3 domain-containing protein [Bernardetiaceae bacterium]|jgi:hypothetical protein|nr:SH3 domain-containing protein [Bernardetiaceae bacterium]
MQGSRLNIFAWALVAWFWTNGPALAQSAPEQLLSQADVLFGKQKYNEAFNLYAKVLDQGESSPQMLLKMAYIRENSGDPTNALYYLNLHYAQAPSTEVHDKIAELAEKNGLEGYKIGDVEYLVYLFRQYFGYLIVLGSLLAGLTLLGLYLIKKRGRDVLYPGIALTTFFGFLFYVINYQLSLPRGIVKSEKAFLMNAPSAGGELVSTLPQGQCLRIVGKQDIWYKVRIDDEASSKLRLKTAAFGRGENETPGYYIRQSNLLVIE